MADPETGVALLVSGGLLVFLAGVLVGVAFGPRGSTLKEKVT